MDGAGNGFFFARYGVPGCAAVDKTTSSRIMLRFRPIAPKPAADGCSAVQLSSEMIKGSTAKGRTKRKYFRVKRSRRSRKSKADVEDNNNSNGSVVTLQLLPEAKSPDLNLDFPAINPGHGLQLPSWITNSDMSQNTNRVSANFLDRRDRRVETLAERKAVQSVVTMQCVTDTYIDGGGLGSTDMERIRNLEMDTCPAFVSDIVDKVQWVNLAYRKMVGPQDGGKALPEVVVCLVVKERLPVEWPAFACRVTWQKEKLQSQTVPCDVWRMDWGGFAWRLDVKAALCLGR